MSEFEYVKNNFCALSLHVEKISARVGVPCPKIVAVTKSASDDELVALVGCGVSAIGENRPGELARRGELLSERGLSPELHQIGTLQSNKAKLVAPRAELIHSLASMSLAKELSKLSTRLDRKIPVLIEINSGEELQKDGVMPSDAEAFLCEVMKLEGLAVSGLMTMGPLVDNPEELRRYYRLTKKLFDRLREQYGFGDNPVLSMGMSDSYEVAIEEGSTLVRVGRKLFIK